MARVLVPGLGLPATRRSFGSCDSDTDKITETAHPAVYLFWGRCTGKPKGNHTCRGTHPNRKEQPVLCKLLLWMARVGFKGHLNESGKMGEHSQERLSYISFPEIKPESRHRRCARARSSQRFAAASSREKAM